MHCIAEVKCVVNAVSHCWKRSWFISGFPSILSVTCSETAVRSEEHNTADVSNSSVHSLLGSCFHSSLALWGVGFSLDVGGIRCQPYSDCPWDSFKWDWHDLATYLWVCAVSQSWDWRTETQCPRLFTATDHVTSDQPLSLSLHTVLD